MNRYSSLELVKKAVQQIDSAEGERRRYEECKIKWTSGREDILAGGRIEDERSVAAACTLQTKLSMLPHKMRQLEELRQNVCDGLAGPLRALRNELSDDHGLLIMRAKEDLISAIKPDLERLLGHAPDSVMFFAVQVANSSLVVTILLGLDPVGSQSMGNPADQARSLLALAGTLERIRETFFKGDKLDLVAVQRKTAFALPS